MLKNDFKIFIRGLQKQKMYSSITVGGFALGITACFLIALFIKHEMGFDKHYADKDNIYRVVQIFKNRGEDERGVHLQAPFAKALMDEFPEIEKAGRINAVELFGAGSNQVRRSDSKQNYFESGFSFADQNLIEILEFNLVYGDLAGALADANNIIISKTKSDKLFPGENPLGKVLILNDNEQDPYKITAVFNDLPDNSHFQSHFIMALHPGIFYRGEQTNWGAYNYYTYLKVKPGTDVGRLEIKLKAIIEKYVIPVAQRYRDTGWEQGLKEQRLELQPVKNIYLESSDLSSTALIKRGDIRLVWMLSAVAVFILIIACINFINLSTAKSVSRKKEIGLKKSVGANRTTIARQFFSESILFCLIAIVLAIILTMLLLPYLNRISGKSIAMPWTEWWFFPVILLTLFSTGLLAGLYPSLHLSAFKPVNILKGATSRPGKNSGMRNGLVVFQFSASVMLIICTLVIYQQMDFILDKNLGFKKDQILLLHGTQTLGDQIKVFKEELESQPQVQSVSVSYYLPLPGTSRNGNPFWNKGERYTEESVGGQHWIVDYDYLKTFGMNLVKGRNFSKDVNSDENAFIINEEMAKQLDLNEPIGKYIFNQGRDWKIIGVVKDFHYESMREKINPLAMRLGRSPQMMAVRTQSEDMTTFLKALNKKWNSFVPDQAIRYDFFNSEYATMYADVQRMGKIFRSFTLLAILVACLGLFGLSEYITRERTKEIGIRKVNGAQIFEILASLNRRFVLWVIIAITIACPLSWYVMNNWLENFAYRIDINWWIFLLAGAASVFIAILTVSWQSIQTARRNPVEALRYE